jgi:hypothetical protein
MTVTKHLKNYSKDPRPYQRSNRRSFSTKNSTSFFNTFMIIQKKLKILHPSYNVQYATISSLLFITTPSICGR